LRLCSGQGSPERDIIKYNKKTHGYVWLENKKIQIKTRKVLEELPENNGHNAVNSLWMFK